MSLDDLTPNRGLAESIKAFLQQQRQRPQSADDSGPVPEPSVAGEAGEAAVGMMSCMSCQDESAERPAGSEWIGRSVKHTVKPISPRPSAASEAAQQAAPPRFTPEILTVQVDGFLPGTLSGTYEEYGCVHRRAAFRGCHVAHTVSDSAAQCSMLQQMLRQLWSLLRLPTYATAAACGLCCSGEAPRL